MSSSTSPASSDSSPSFGDVSASPGVSARPRARRYQAAARRGAREPRTTLRSFAPSSTLAGIDGAGSAARIKTRLPLRELDDLDVVAIGIDQCAEEPTLPFVQLDQPRHAQAAQAVGGG